MDKRKRWREQEERLVARWNAAALRYREVQAEISSQGTETDELKLKAQTAREEIEAVRREVARLKVEFNSGKRY
jgi:chromosome segregation ATPase